MRRGNVLNLEGIFKSINKKMLLDFDEISSEIKHRGSKGRVREFEIVNEYLSKYIPGNIGVANGELISKDDQVSSEVDIVLFEKNSTPYLLKKEGYQVFPIECVYGMIEVKSQLDKNQLEDSFKKIHKIKKMPKSAYEPQKGPIVKTTTIYGKEWQHFPTLGFVIAFDSIDLKTIVKHLGEIQKDTALEHRIDSLWILKKGMIINFNQVKGLIELTPSHETIPKAILSDNPLMLLTVQLQSLLMSGWMPKFQIRQYLSNAIYGDFYE